MAMKNTRGPSVTTAPDDPEPGSEAHGRQVGEAWARRQRRSRALTRLARAYRERRRWYPVAGFPHGCAYGLYKVLFGTPVVAESEPIWFGGPNVPAVVTELWEEELDDPDGYEVANNAGFTDGFIAGALGVWDELQESGQQR